MNGHISAAEVDTVAVASSMERDVAELVARARAAQTGFEHAGQEVLDAAAAAALKATHAPRHLNPTCLCPGSLTMSMLRLKT